MLKSTKLLLIFGVVLAFILSGALEVFTPWNLPAPAQVALAILMIAATLWISEAVPMFVTSFVVLGLSLIWLVPRMRSEGMVISEHEFLAPFFSDVILLFLGGFVLSAAMHKYQLDERLARWMLARTGRRVPVVLFGIMVVTAMLSMWLSNTATAAMMLAVCLPIARQLPSDDAYRKAIPLAVAFAANVGGLGTPIGSPPNAIAMQYMQEGGFAPSFGMWMLIGTPGVVVMLAVVWTVLMLVFRGHQATIEMSGEKVGIKWSWPVMLVVGVTLVTVLSWITSGVHGLTAGTVALLPVVVFFGTKILTVKNLKMLSWDVLLMMGGGLCLGKVIAVSGLAAWIVQRLPIESSNCFVLVAILGSAACLMSSIMSNTATANLLMPISLGLGAENLSPVLVGVAFACTLAMPLPISTPPNAIIFGSGELKVREMLLPGAMVTVVGLVLAMTTGHWWWDWVGLF